MLQKEQWMQIHVLKARRIGREIARRLGISRNTVARYLSAEEVPRYKPREPRPTKQGRSRRTSSIAWLPPHRDHRRAGLLRELRARGYDANCEAFRLS